MKLSAAFVAILAVLCAVPLGCLVRQACMPGQQNLCACAPGVTGFQTCSPSGDAVSACDCGSTGVRDTSQMPPQAGGGTTQSGTLPSAPIVMHKGIECGSLTCDSVCCMSFGPVCAQDRNECPRATNGEGNIFECDGPEDCAANEVCCSFSLDRTNATACWAPKDCQGVFHHPRYDVDIPRVVVCRQDGNCVNGGRCRNGQCQ